MGDPIRTEEFRVDTDKIVGKAKSLYNESNARRVNLKTKEGKQLLEMPLWLAGIILLLAIVVVPWLVAILVIAALVMRMSIIIERENETPPSPPTTTDDI